MTPPREPSDPTGARRPRGRPPRDSSLAPGDPGVLAGPGAESLARAILHSLPSHLAVIERDGRIVAVNKAWEMFSQEISDLWPDVPALGIGRAHV